VAKAEEQHSQLRAAAHRQKEQVSTASEHWQTRKMLGLPDGILLCLSTSCSPWRLRSFAWISVMCLEVLNIMSTTPSWSLVETLQKPIQKMGMVEQQEDESKRPGGWSTSKD